MSYNMGVAEGHLDLDFSDLRTATASAVRELDKLERAGNLSQSQMNKLEATTKGTAGVFEQANQKAASLSKQIDNAKQKVSVYKTAIDGLNDIIKRNASEQESLRGKISAANTTLDKAEQKVKELSGAHRTATQEAESAAEAVKAAAKQYGEESDEVKKATAAHEDAVKAQKEAKEAYDKAAESAQKHRNELLQLESREASLGRETEDSKAKINDFAAKINNTEADIANMSRELQTTESKLATFGAAAQTAGEKWKTAGDKISKAGNALTIGVSVPLATAGVSVFKAASDFESAFTGVEKTVDATDQQLAALKQGIIDMSQEIPASTTTIAAVAEAAGQLGIQTDNILSFTRVMVDLGNATNLTAEDAASALAKFANVTGMSQTDFDKLGATIVALGNNFATTEADIVAMGTRLAGAGSQVGMTEPQIMGLATALSSVGIEAEMGGSAFSTLMSKMQLSVEQGGEGLKAFAEVAGMSAEQFQTAFKEDAAGAIVAFIQGLSNCEDKGKSAIGVLDDMGITEIRQRDALLRAAGASDVFTEAIQMGSQAWEENTALTNEASKRYETTESRLQMAKNAITEAARSLGQLLIPEVTNIAKQVKNAADKFAKLDDKTKKNIISIAKFAVAIGPVTKGIGFLVNGASSAATNIGKFCSALSKSKTSTNTAKKGIEGVLSVIKGIPTSAKLAVGAAALLGLGIAAAMKKAHDAAVKANIEKHWGDVKLSAEEVEDVAKRLTTTDWTMKVDAVIDARKKLDDFQAEIESAIETINKTEWKVSVGLELTEDEKESYKQAISSYISNVQSYINQHHFSTTLAIDTILVNGTSARANAEKLSEEYYGGLNETLTQLGNELSELVNTAFEDNILSEDEIAKIDEKKAEIQKKLDEIQQAEYEIKLHDIKADAEKDGISKDSFEELQKQLNENIEDRKKQVEETKRQLLIPYQIKLNNRDNMLSSEIDALEEDWQQIELSAQKKLGDIELDSLNVSVGTIKSNYSEEVNKWQNDVSTNLDKAMKNTGEAVNTEVFWDVFSEQWTAAYYSSRTDKATQEVVQDCLDAMRPTTESLEDIAQSYYDAGKIPPKNITDGLMDIYQLEAMVGNTDHLWELIANQIATSPEYQATIKAAVDNGQRIPEELANTLKNNYGLVYDTTTGLWQQSTDSAAATVEANKTTNNQTGQQSVQDIVDGQNSVDTATPAAKKVDEAVAAMDKTFSDAQLDFLGSSYGKKVPTGFAAGMGGAIGLVAAQTDSIEDEVNVLSSLPSDTWGSHLASGFASGISSTTYEISNAAWAAAEAAKAALHFTRPDEGPLRNYEQWPVHFISRYAELMQKQKSKVQQAALAVANCAADALSMSAVGKDFDLNQYAFNDFRGTMTIRADADLIDYDRLADALAARLNDRPIVVESRIDNHTTVEMDKEIVGRKVAPVVSKVIAKNSKLHK